MKLPFWIEAKINNITKPLLICIVEIKVDGKRKHKFYCKSLLHNFLANLYEHFANFVGADFDLPEAPYTAINSLIDVNGNSLLLSATRFHLHAAAGNVDYGMVVGTGTNAPLPNDFKLQTKILEGVGAGQLNYKLQSGLIGTRVVGNKTTFVLERLFTNNSGAAINVTEAGIQTTDKNTGTTFFLMMRDTFTAVNVPNTSNLVIQTTFQIIT